MVLLDAATGLRRSELLALKWEDIDFERLQINVRRSIYLNVVGNCKTEASRKPVPRFPIFMTRGERKARSSKFYPGALRLADKPGRGFGYWPPRAPFGSGSV